MAHPRPRLLALLLLALGGTASLAADPGSQDCVECGLRRPGQRPRELAILESVASAACAPSKAASGAPAGIRRLPSSRAKAAPADLAHELDLPRAR